MAIDAIISGGVLPQVGGVGQGVLGGVKISLIVVIRWFIAICDALRLSIELAAAYCVIPIFLSFSTHPIYTSRQSPSRCLDGRLMTEHCPSPRSCETHCHPSS